MSDFPKVGEQKICTPCSAQGQLWAWHIAWNSVSVVILGPIVFALGIEFDDLRVGGLIFIMMFKTETGWRWLGWRGDIYLTFKLD